MIWGILKRSSKLDVFLPARLTRETMYPLISQAIDGNADARSDHLFFDFNKLGWIDPAGITVLSNLFEYLMKTGAKVSLKNHRNDLDVIRYLDDSMFFERYVGHKIQPSASIRGTTIPLMLVEKEKVYEFLDFKLMPWIGGRTFIDPKFLESIKMCLMKVFLNIEHHSEVKIGCSYAQHYPQQDSIHIAVSDFGVGIPKSVRKVQADADDKTAIYLACQEGFTTKSNVRNRGAGIPNLMRYVTKSNKGAVLIASGSAQVSASSSFGETKVTARAVDGYYPGTLVHVILKTNTLSKMVEDIQPEEFVW